MLISVRPKIKNCLFGIANRLTCFGSTQNFFLLNLRHFFFSFPSIQIISGKFCHLNHFKSVLKKCRPTDPPSETLGRQCQTNIGLSLALLSLPVKTNVCKLLFCDQGCYQPPMSTARCYCKKGYKMGPQGLKCIGML